VEYILPRISESYYHMDEYAEEKRREEKRREEN